MEKKVIITINMDRSFTNLKHKTNSWVHHRMDLFFTYCFPSLIGQTNQNFTALVLFPSDIAHIIQKELPLFSSLPDHIIFMDYNSVEDFIHNAIIGFDSFLHVIIDSDSALSKTYVDEIINFSPKKTTEVLVSILMYLYQKETDTFYYGIHAAPVCFTFVYNVKDYLSGKRYVISNYEMVPYDFQIEDLPDYNLLVPLHDESPYGNKYMVDRMPKVKPEKISRIMNRFDLSL